MRNVIAWHFAGATLRDGSPLPAAGVTLQEIAEPIPCRRGYHGSERLIDALMYAPETNLARVRVQARSLTED